MRESSLPLRVRVILVAPFDRGTGYTTNHGDLPVVWPAVILDLMNEITRILGAIEQGESRAAGHLLPLVYEELRRLAAEKMAQERPGQTLQATALVHEAYLRLVDVEKAQHWTSRGHFFAAAAEAMRRILVENARRKKSAKHGGGRERVNWELAQAGLHGREEKLIDLDEALTRFEKQNPLQAKLV